MQWDNILLTLLMGGMIGQLLNVIFGNRTSKQLVGTVKEIADTLSSMKNELTLLGNEMEHAVDSIDKNDDDHTKIEEKLHSLDTRVTLLEEKRKK